jgi:WD40 repeat protein
MLSMDARQNMDEKYHAASCCLQIVTWDGATGAKLRELEGHSSYVKGIAWDPVGTYLASQVRWHRNSSRYPIVCIS